MSQDKATRAYAMKPWEWIAAILTFGLLGAVLLPVYAGDHGPRAASQTMSGLKQIAFGSLLYSQDYDGFVPHHGHFAAKDEASGKRVMADQMAWRAALMPYIKNEEIFYTRHWPFLKQKGDYIHLVRGETNNGSSFGYTENLTAKLVGSPNGWFVLNIASPPAELIETYGSVAKVPMLEELAWTVDKWFGQKEIQRSSQKIGRRAVARLDGSFRLAQVQD